MDIVWLKKDVRIHDHGPFAEICKNSNVNRNNNSNGNDNGTPFCILYLFEPDQLSESSVHGSHICFINEGLVALDKLLCGIDEGDDNGDESGDDNSATASATANAAGIDDDDDDDDVADVVGRYDNINAPSSTTSSTNNNNNNTNYTFQKIITCHANAVYTFNTIHKHYYRIARILAHQETGHYKSFVRDKTLRKWCRLNGVDFVEYNQSGVTRCLRDRDSFALKLNQFLGAPLYYGYQNQGQGEGEAENENELEKVIVLVDVEGNEGTTRGKGEGKVEDEDNEGKAVGDKPKFNCNTKLLETVTMTTTKIKDKDVNENGGGDDHGNAHENRKETRNTHLNTDFVPASAVPSVALAAVAAITSDSTWTSSRRRRRPPPPPSVTSASTLEANAKTKTKTMTQYENYFINNKRAIIRACNTNRCITPSKFLSNNWNHNQHDNNDDDNNNNESISTCTRPHLHGFINHPISLNALTEIPVEHRADRPSRQQYGGETHALNLLHNFLNHSKSNKGGRGGRGQYYSKGISSPNTSWVSCSRLSPYLTWGHISLRMVVKLTREKQALLRAAKKKKKKSNNSNNDEGWLKSLQAFSSRIHWRSHFIQKLESEPEIEKRDLCTAYQHLRRQPDDWNQSFYVAWSTGYTGFPFVDACMRCLMEHGWLNFRMRAMVVSFATYNLWLDWKRIAPHLARVFLDYEPGIHYPQLQMQSGTTGINAMRVYNVTKQGKDQDPNGIFIRKYVEELRDVPLEYLFEPSKMPLKMQEKIGVYIGTAATLDSLTEGQQLQQRLRRKYYPAPIVNEQQSAKIAKDKVSAVRKQGSTKRLADEVYLKHGSRNNREREMSNVSSKKIKASSTPSSSTSPSKKKEMIDKSQRTIKDMFTNTSTTTTSRNKSTLQNPKGVSLKSHSSQNHNDIGHIMTKMNRGKTRTATEKCQSWSCAACTFINEKPFALSCSMCGTLRR